MKMKELADVKRYNTQSKNQLLNQLSLLETKCPDTDVVRQLRKFQTALSAHNASASLEIVDIDKKIKALLVKAAPNIVKNNKMAVDFIMQEIDKLITERGVY